MAREIVIGDKSEEQVLTVVQQVMDDTHGRNNIETLPGGGGSTRIRNKDRTDIVIIKKGDGAILVDLFAAQDRTEDELLQELGEETIPVSTQEQEDKQSWARGKDREFARDRGRKRDFQQADGRLEEIDIDGFGRITRGEVDAFEDGSIRFLPPFSKERADYDLNGNEGGKNCRDCAHFVEGGGCLVVQGRIRPQDVCHEFFADFGTFADNVDPEIDISLSLFGEQFDWDRRDITDFIDQLREKMEGRIG